VFEAFRRGEEKAFEELYRRYRKPIFQYVIARVPDVENAEDLTQEIFLKIYRFRDSYQENYAFSTWLWAIAKNSVADFLRVRKECLVSDPEAAEEVPCGAQNAESILLKKDRRKKLRRLARGLTRPQRRVLWLHLVHHLSFVEISKRLNLSLTAVKNLAYRARLRLVEN
jgi:RNA polymerase sigma-70 factor (ECF subfamily)